MFSGHDGVANAKSGVARVTLRELAILRDLAQEWELRVQRWLVVTMGRAPMIAQRRPQ